ncbi:unnamed protein product, partial [Gadus morhua 'NCC']
LSPPVVPAVMEHGGDVAIAHDRETVHPDSAATAVAARCTTLGARGYLAGPSPYNLHPLPVSPPLRSPYILHFVLLLLPISPPLPFPYNLPILYLLHITSSSSSFSLPPSHPPLPPRPSNSSPSSSISPPAPLLPTQHLLLLLLPPTF